MRSTPVLPFPLALVALGLLASACAQTTPPATASAAPASPAAAPVAVVAASAAPVVAGAGSAEERQLLGAVRQAILELAGQDLAEDRASAAELKLTLLLGRSADDAEARFLLGVASLAQGRLEDAREQLERADALRPDDPDTLSLLARVAFESEGPLVARPLLERVVRLQPDDALHWSNLGQVCLEQGDLLAAHDALATAAACDGELAVVHRGLGRLYALMGQPDLAERAWRTALLLDDSDVLAWVCLGHALRDLGRDAEALDSYERAQALAPDDPWVAANRGSALLALDRPAAARAPLLAAVAGLEDHPEDAWLALSDLGLCLSRSGDLDGAEDAWRQAIELAPSGQGPRAALGELLLARGRKAAARAELGAGFDQAGLPPALALELILLHEAAGDSAAARAVAAVLLQPGADPALRLVQARLRLLSTDPSLADPVAGEAALRELLLGPLADHAGGWALLSQVLAQRGALAEAVQALDEALSHGGASPARSGWDSRRAELVERLGRR